VNNAGPLIGFSGWSKELENFSEDIGRIHTRIFRGDGYTAFQKRKMFSEYEREANIVRSGRKS
jgi:hypothetical protein